MRAPGELISLMLRQETSFVHAMFVCGKYALGSEESNIPVDSSGPNVMRPRITRGVGLEAMRGMSGRLCEGRYYESYALSGLNSQVVRIRGLNLVM